MVGELPTAQNGTSVTADAQARWRVRVKRKRLETAATRIAPGLSVYRPPASAAWELVNSFVNVELSTPAPKDALALVVTKSKGPALSWGGAFANASSLNVFSTGSGCFTTPSEGTVQAQPGDTVTLFWVDQYGRRSRVTPAIVVEKL